MLNARIAVSMFASKNHMEQRTLLLELLFHFGTFLQSLHNREKFCFGIVLITELPPTQANHKLHQVALKKELTRTIHQTLQIMPLGAIAESQHLHLRLLAVHALLTFLFTKLIKILTEVPDLHHGRICLGGDFNHIHLLSFGFRQYLCERTDLRTLIPYKEHIRRTDFIVDSRTLLLAERNTRTVVTLLQGEMGGRTGSSLRQGDEVSKRFVLQKHIQIQQTNRRKASGK